MGLLKKIGKAVGKVVGAVFKPIGSLLNALIPKPKIPKSIETRGTTYNAEARINEGRLGDPKPVLYGEGWFWPPYKSMPYTMFVGHDQVLCAWVVITVGRAQIPVIRIGDTPATTLPGFEWEVLAPGEEMELILPNVYTAPEVSGGVEMQAGAYELDGTAIHDPTIGDGIIVIKKKTGVTTEFTNDGGQGVIEVVGELGFFSEFLLGDVIGIYDGPAGDEELDFTIAEISDDGTTIRLVETLPETGTNPGDVGFFVRQRWAGPFPACPPGATIEEGAIDVEFSALFDNEADRNRKAVRFHLQYRPISDAGVVLDTTWADASVPVILDTEEDPDIYVFSENGTPTAAPFCLKDNVNRPRRITVPYSIPDGAGRYEMRFRRETMQGNDNQDLSDCRWSGLKGYILAKPGDTPTVEDDCTTLAVKIRSSGRLASTSERSLNVRYQRELSVYESGGWSDPQVTRNPIWADADWKLNQSNEAVVTEDLDLDDYVTHAANADARQDTFDGVFDREVGLWEGSQTILRVARSKPIRNPLTRLYTIYRDEPSDPVVMLCDGFNTRLGTDSINLPDADTVTGVQVTFMDPLLWVEREGPVVGTETDVRKSRAMGLTSWQKSFDEATYQIRDLYYRNHSVSAETEMDGLLPIHGNRVLVASALKGWGHAGEVVEEVDTTTLQVWPAPVWTPGADHYVYLQDEDGTPVGPINVTQGATPNFLILESDPGITIRTGGGWKTLYAFGHDGDSGMNPDAPRIAIVQSRSANSLRTATLDLLFDHPYVHEDPGPAPEDPYDTDGTIPDLTLTGLTAEQVLTGDFLLDPNGEPLTDPSDEFLVPPGGVEGGVAVTASWDAEPGATSYQLRWRYVAVPGWHYASTIGTSLTFAVPMNGQVRIRVKALSTTYVGPEAQTQVVIDAY